MYHFYYYPYVVRSNDRIIAELKQAINGEFSAIQCYEKLANLAPDEKIKNQILEIRKDEITHFQSFSRIYTNLTGKKPEPEITEECPDSYREGLDSAFQDEQRTTDFYLEIAYNAASLYVKQAFIRAARDEQNHAVWFLYYLTKK